MAQWTREVLEREAAITAAVEEALAEAGPGGDAIEYDNLADLPPAPTDGNKAIIGGLVLEAIGGAWVWQELPAPETPTSTSEWSNVANALDFVSLTFDGPSPEIPTSTSAWSAVP
jgi:hypothetical protein